MKHNFRVIKSKCKSEEDLNKTEDIYDIHEVWYNNEGLVEDISTRLRIIEDSPLELFNTLNSILSAFKYPIIDNETLEEIPMSFNLHWELTKTNHWLDLGYLAGIGDCKTMLTDFLKIKEKELCPNAV